MINNKTNSSGEKSPGLYQRFVNINKEHPVLMNFIYVLLMAFVLVWVLLEFLDSWTRHGDEATVPSLKGQSVELAEITLRGQGFGFEIMDSVFDSTLKPGTIVEQTPSAGAVVKPGRKVYATIVAFTPKMVTVPEYLNVSRRQGQSIFEGLGLNVNVVTIASEYKDLVLGAKVNGVPLRVGQRIPVTANVTLEVGGGVVTDDEINPNYVMEDRGIKREEPDEETSPDYGVDNDDDSTINKLLQE